MSRKKPYVSEECCRPIRCRANCPSRTLISSRAASTIRNSEYAIATSTKNIFPFNRLWILLSNFGIGRCITVQTERNTVVKLSHRISTVPRRPVTLIQLCDRSGAVVFCAAFAGSKVRSSKRWSTSSAPIMRRRKIQDQSGDVQCTF